MLFLSVITAVRKVSDCKNRTFVQSLSHGRDGDAVQSFYCYICSDRSTWRRKVLTKLHGLKYNPCLDYVEFISCTTTFKYSECKAWDSSQYYWEILIDLHNWFSLDQYSVNVWWYSDILSKSLFFLILNLNFVLILINWNIYIFLYFLTLTD